MLKLFNLHILTKDDFQTVANDGIYLNNNGKRKFFVQYEKMAGGHQGEVPDEDTKTGFRQVFQKMVYDLAKHIQNDKPLTL